MRYWISWLQPTDDYRPLTYPPKDVIGYWCTGQECGESSQAYILCAVVTAENVQEAKNAILINWPEAERWRFADMKSDTWMPSSDRFPLPK